MEDEVREVSIFRVARSLGRRVTARATECAEFVEAACWDAAVSTLGPKDSIISMVSSKIMPNSPALRVAYEAVVNAVVAGIDSDGSDATATTTAWLGINQFLLSREREEERMQRLWSFLQLRVAPGGWLPIVSAHALANGISNIQDAGARLVRGDVMGATPDTDAAAAAAMGIRPVSTHYMKSDEYADAVVGALGEGARYRRERKVVTERLLSSGLQLGGSVTTTATALVPAGHPVALQPVAADRRSTPTALAVTHVGTAGGGASSASSGATAPKFRLAASGGGVGEGMAGDAMPVGVADGGTTRKGAPSAPSFRLLDAGVTAAQGDGVIDVDEEDADAPGLSDEVMAGVYGGDGEEGDGGGGDDGALGLYDL